MRECPYNWLDEIKGWEVHCKDCHQLYTTVDKKPLYRCTVCNSTKITMTPQWSWNTGRIGRTQ